MTPTRVLVLWTGHRAGVPTSVGRLAAAGLDAPVQERVDGQPAARSGGQGRTAPT